VVKPGRVTQSIHREQSGQLAVGRGQPNDAEIHERSLKSRDLNRARWGGRGVEVMAARSILQEAIAEAVTETPAKKTVALYIWRG
jgi:hypothetical protein